MHRNLMPLPASRQDPLHADAEPPPFFGTWPRVYALVLGYLATLIVVLYALTRLFHY